MDFGEAEKMPGDIAVENCISRSVRDSATVFSLSEDTSPHARFKPTGFVSAPAAKRLRIAYSTASYLGKEPHADVRTCVEASAKLCQGLGHQIVEAKNPISGQQFIDAFLTVWASGPAQLVQLATSLKLKPEAVLEPWTIGLAEYFAKQPKDALAKSLAYLKKVEATTDAFLSQYDAWLTPVLSSAPPKLGEQAPTVPFETLYTRVTDYVAYTPIHNVAGTPAMSVPLGWAKNGLPIGTQSRPPRAMKAFSTRWPMSWSRLSPGPRSTAIRISIDFGQCGSVCSRMSSRALIVSRRMVKQATTISTNEMTSMR